MTRFDGLMNRRIKASQADHLEESPSQDQPSKVPKRRSKGKRNDPDYTQVTAYIRKATHNSVKIALLQEGQGREFSELVEDLLGEYLRTQKSDNLDT